LPNPFKVFLPGKVQRVKSDADKKMTLWKKTFSNISATVGKNYNSSVCAS
jgi:hypothetical protein